MDEAEFCDRLVLISQGRLIAQGTPRELKEAVPEQIIAVYPDRLDDALEVIKKLPDIAEAAVFGTGLHVATLKADQTEAAVRQALAAQQIAIKSMARVPPSLEDAFISLTTRAGR
jgi:ABC-2 type transport system ATP-binding protein